MASTTLRSSAHSTPLSRYGSPQEHGKSRASLEQTPYRAKCQWSLVYCALRAHSASRYFVAANPSIDRHLYSASLPTSQLGSEYTQNHVAMTDTDLPGYHKVSMSPGAGYYVLTYAGPEVPWQRVIAVEANELDELLEGNGALNDTLAEFMRPSVSRMIIENDGYGELLPAVPLSSPLMTAELNVQQIFPPNMDTTGRKKYPVLVRVYGGPGSQLVSDEWVRDWHTYLACEMKYIIVIIDGRGTGFKGRALRNPVTDNLGYWEAVDQIAGAREMAKRIYVDRSRIGLWGWVCLLVEYANLAHEE